MRIGLFADTYIPFINGVSSSVATLKNELEKHGHQVFVVTTNPVNKYIEWNDNVLRLPGLLLKKLYGYRLSWIYSGRAMKYIKKMNLDLIHTHQEFGIGIFAKIAASKLKLPLVYTYHTMYEDYTHYITRGHFDFLARSVVYKLSKFYATSCTELISPSLKTKEALRRYGVDKYINIIPTGIDLDKFDPRKNSREQLLAKRKQLGIPEDAFLIVSLGRIAPEKNIELILDGFRALLGKTGKAEYLLIVGDGPSRESLQQKALDLDLGKRVIFTGKVMLDEVPIYYQIGDLFVAASVTETQGLTYIEALASGLPVLACYDKNLDSMLKDGETGFFFSDTETFVEKTKVIMALDEEAKAFMAQKIKEKAVSFSSETFYQNIKVVYQRAIRAKW